MEYFEDRWWDPEELHKAALAISAAVTSNEFFNNSGYKQVREMIVAAEFALKKPWNKAWKIRPVHAGEEFPDFKLKSGSDVRPFEVVEADRKNRKRGDEYRKPPAIEHNDPNEEARQAPCAIERALEQKAQKNYCPRPNLLIYVNLSGGKPAVPWAYELEKKFGPSFPSVWLLWQSQVFRLWPDPAKIVGT